MLLILKYVEAKLHVREASFATLIAIILIFSYVAHIAGLHGIFGALLLGFTLSRIKDDPVIQRAIESLKIFAYGVFIPLFFASAGLYMSKNFINVGILTILYITAFIIIMKLFAGYLCSKLVSSSNAGMKILICSQLSKGGVELAILSHALTLGIINDTWYSLSILIILIFMILTSLILNNILIISSILVFSSKYLFILIYPKSFDKSKKYLISFALPLALYKKFI